MSTNTWQLWRADINVDRSVKGIRVRATDGGGRTFEKSFTVSVTDVNETPTEITLSNSSIAENQPAGSSIGRLAARRHWAKR